MTRGGARNRSGPQKDPNSARSDRNGVAFETLPAAGYDGDPPPFPLMPRVVMRWEFEDKRRYQVCDDEATEEVRERETALWEWAWRTPQAAAWARESWRWQTVAMWVRTFVICEGDGATAADKGAVHRFADQIGMTPAGLRENGWRIGTEAVETDGAGPQQKAEPTLRDQAAADAGWKVIDGGRAG